MSTHDVPVTVATSRCVDRQHVAGGAVWATVTGSTSRKTRYSAAPGTGAHVTDTWPGPVDSAVADAGGFEHAGPDRDDDRIGASAEASVDDLQHERVDAECQRHVEVEAPTELNVRP